MKISKLCVGVVIGMTLLAIPVAAQSELTWARKLFDDANGERKEAGLPLLSWNDKLAEAARTHAEQMAAHKKLSHKFEGEPSLTARAAATKVHFGFIAENVAFATYAEDIHSGLMRSIEHRANILSAKANSLGVAVIKVDDGCYAVEDFAYSTAADDSETAEQRLISAFNRARKEQHKFPAQITSDPQLRTEACGMAENGEVAVKGLPIPRGFQHMLGYTISEPDDLPESLQEVVSEPSNEILSVGACYKATRSYPGGVYWVIIVY